MDKDNHKIEEIAWAQSYAKPEPTPGVPQPPTYPTRGSAGTQGIHQRAKFKGVLEKCSQMYTFQKTIYGALKNGKDIYVAANPGAGKTLPYLCYWSQLVIDIDTLDIHDREWKDYIDTIEQLLIKPETLPKLLILAPTRELSNQVYNEFRVHFSKILSNILNALLQKLIETSGTLPAHPRIRQLLKIIHPTLSDLSDQRDEIYAKLYSSERDRVAVGEKRIEQLKREVEALDKHIENYGVEGIRNITDSQKATKSLIAIRHGNETSGDINSSPVVIGIYESIEKYISKLKDNLAVVVCDESHLIQDKEIRDSSRATNISYALYTILRTISNKTRLCFLSGTANPDSAKNFTSYLELCYGRKNISVIEPPGSAANPSQITVHADDSINSERALVNIMASRQTHHTVIVLFSKKKIDKLAQSALHKLGRKPLHNIGALYKFTDTPSKTPFSRYRDVSSKPQIDVEKVGREAGRMEGASHIFDSKQREYVQAGFGVIYRVDDRDRYRKEKSKDNQIIADMFQKGKIRVLLATDAIGVGVNIDVKTMYIPTIEKFHGGSFKPMEPSELSQLINRTGRAAFMYSNVVTTSQHVAPITTALSLAPRQFAKTVTIEKMPKEVCKSAKAFMSLWRNQVKIKFA